MKGRRQLKAMFRDPNMKELIESLWREYPGLYNEKYNRDPEKWLLNLFGEEVESGQALGQDHSINGNQSIAIGIGAITKAFRELVLGSYPTAAPTANPSEWVELDRLITVGKGIDEDNRGDALILFKSGLLKLSNAMLIGKFQHGDELAEDGTLQYTPENGLQWREDNTWKQAGSGDKNYHHTQGVPATVWSIDHQMGKYPSVTVIDTSGSELEGEVTHTDQNNVILTFSAAFAGSAEFN